MTPLQIICKSGRVNEATINMFARIGGPDVFSVVDGMGNTPLHSAMREDTDIEALLALMKVFPDALYAKTMYGDTPLHLACLRRLSNAVVHEVALASSAGLEAALIHSNGRLSPILATNTAGQTPISIAMEEYQGVCDDPRRTCCVNALFNAAKTRTFDVLSTLVKILHYGPVDSFNGQPLSLVAACVSLHRMDVRLDPAFIRRAIQKFPEDALIVDKAGNTPLHIEASIPIEKLTLLDGFSGCCDGACHKRIGILQLLLEINPDATSLVNESSEYPLTLMIQNGRSWDKTFALVVQSYPEALHNVENLDRFLLPVLLQKLSAQCGISTVYSFIRDMP
jgi:hypothetical protein